MVSPSGEDATHRGASISVPERLGPLRDEPLVAVVSSTRGATIVPLPEKSPFLLGRSVECEVTIGDPSVSRRHLRMSVGDDIRVVDLGSANGTTYDGAALGPWQERVIGLARPLALGGVTLLVHAAQSVVAPGRAAGPGVLFTPPSVEIVRDEALKRIYALLPSIGPSLLSVLIQGETGVGKEVFADALHRSSGRADAPFVKINCAALPESLLEGELFGYEKGAFSGAVVARPGLFEAAHRGTVFLDEIGELPLHTQAKLLRLFETGEVMRLGSRTPTRIDVRVVSATNRDLKASLARGEFRADLYYRLEGVRVEIPPLRQRPNDVVALAEFFLARLAGRMGLIAPQITPGAADALRAYAWPGNVRELRNVVERALVMNPEAEELTEALLLVSAPASVTEPPPPPSATTCTTMNLPTSLGEIEKQAIVDALARTKGNQSAAARLLGIGRHALITRLDAYGITRKRS
jgi:transcriptional regulator with AAA-type ATPase domain